MRYSLLDKALEIFKKYNPDGLIHAEHEYIYTYLSVKSVSQEDRDSLKELGWHENGNLFCIFTENRANAFIHDSIKTH